MDSRWRWAPPLRAVSSGFNPTAKDPPLQTLLLQRDPSGWAMLVGTIMLQASNRRAVDLVWPSFFQTWPEAGVVLDDIGETNWRVQDSMAEILQPTGLQSQKANRVCKMSLEWVRDGHETTPPEYGDIAAMTGLGPYGVESWALFVDGQLEWRYDDGVVARWAELLRSGALPPEVRPTILT